MNNKILYCLMIIAIIIGAIMVRFKGYNYTTIYSDHKRLEVSMGQSFELKDVKALADESFKNDTVVRKTTLFDTSFAVDVKEISDDELNTFFGKLNEKYGKNFSLNELKRNTILYELGVTDKVENMTDDELKALISQITEKYNMTYTVDELKTTETYVRTTDVIRIRVLDTVIGLLLPMLITAVIVGLYYAIRFRKLYKNAWIIRPLKLEFKLILVLGFILAVLVIARIPVGSYLGTLLIMAFLATMLVDNYSAELALEKVKEKDK